MRADLLIHDGTVIDSTAAPPFRADVAIKDGKIVGVGTIEKQEGIPCIDAQDLFVAPGFIFKGKAHPEFSRRSIAEISEVMCVAPLDAIYDLLLAEIDDLHSLMILAFTYREKDIRIAFEHPSCMVGSDATALATDGPLAGTSFHGAYTWASWFYRHFVRDRKTLSPQEAIRRITSLPASRLGLTDRGVLRVGACADVAIFDPKTFADPGTTFEPNQTALGMHHVIVNGKIAVRDGKLTGERSGEVLRHG